MASVYWIKSLVPMDRKSSCFKNIGSAIVAAAGTSIMPPTCTLPLNLRCSSVNCSFARSMAASDWRISPSEASIGIRMRTSPCGAAQDCTQLRVEHCRLGKQ